MNKKLSIIIISFLMFFTLGIKMNAEESIKFFYKDNCQHCSQELEWLNEYVKEENISLEKINIDDNNGFKEFEEYLDHFDIKIPSVPLLINGDKYYQGYISKEEFIKQVQNKEQKSCSIDLECEEESGILPFIKQDNTPLIIVAAILGLIDGFNPCAMWVLLILLSFLIQIEDRKKMIFLGSIFIFVSGFMYFLIISSWINIRPLLSKIKYMQTILAFTLLLMGLYSLFTNLKKRKACKVNTNKRRSYVISKLKEIVDAQSIIYASISIVILAVVVNLIELGCSLGIPMMFTEILNRHNLSQIQNVFYLLIYIFFFVLDDLLVFVIAIKSFEIKAISNKFTKSVQIVSAVILIIFALIMLFNPSLI